MPTKGLGNETQEHRKKDLGIIQFEGLAMVAAKMTRNVWPQIPDAVAALNKDWEKLHGPVKCPKTGKARQLVYIGGVWN